MSSSNKPKKWLRILCCICSNSGEKKKKTRRIGAKLAEVVRKNSSDRQIFKNKGISTPIREIRNQRAREKEEKERCDQLQLSKKITQKEEKSEDLDLQIFGRNLKTFNNYTDDNFSDKEISNTERRRNSWSTSRMSPFTDTKNEFASRRKQKNIKNEPIRSFQLGTAEKLHSSYKSKKLLVQNTGTTSVGMLSTKKQSKVGEDLDCALQNESYTKKMVHPSPQVKLNQRKIPRKEQSKASKSSSKKSQKKRRVPKKYTKPNMNKEKVSNKSLVNDDTGHKDLLATTSGNDSQRPSINSELKPKNNSTNKVSARFTITKDDVLAKQGVIPEDQNEDYYTDENESDSSEETVSSVEENKYENFSLNSSKELALPPPQMIMKKFASANPPTRNAAGTTRNPFISPSVSTNKEAVDTPINSYAGLLSPLPDIHCGHKRVSKSRADDSFALRATSQKDFQTDLSLLKNKSVAERSKKVNSRLKMMI
ncbi:unnamed protein product [Moneuplotes crassus]|uniref:Uncharacterized protein n=1 Tax=Euplotes crassus TaxID=5936 RepID=A0AAD1U5D9_EUPCR|nr:unnamed protein product [Moneuplotes crassus]